MVADYVRGSDGRLERVVVVAPNATWLLTPQRGPDKLIRRVLLTPAVAG